MDYIIIVAGGKGLRMGSEIPKQFLPIGGKPVLMRTLERFREYSKELQIILVLPKAQQDYWHQLCEVPMAVRPVSTLYKTAWHLFLTIQKGWWVYMMAFDLFRP